jgi:hypothetical protein
MVSGASSRATGGVSRVLADGSELKISRAASALGFEAEPDAPLKKENSEESLDSGWGASAEGGLWMSSGGMVTQALSAPSTAVKPNRRNRLISGNRLKWGNKLKRDLKRRNSLHIRPKLGLTQGFTHGLKQSFT